MARVGLAAVPHGPHSAGRMGVDWSDFHHLAAAAGTGQHVTPVERPRILVTLRHRRGRAAPLRRDAVQRRDFGRLRCLVAITHRAESVVLAVPAATLGADSFHVTQRNKNAG